MDMNIYTWSGSRYLVSFPNRNYPKFGVKRTSSSFSWSLNLADSLCSTVGLKANVLTGDISVLAAQRWGNSKVHPTGLHTSWEWVSLEDGQVLQERGPFMMKWLAGCLSCSPERNSCQLISLPAEHPRPVTWLEMPFPLSLNEELLHLSRRKGQWPRLHGCGLCRRNTPCPGASASTGLLASAPALSQSGWCVLGQSSGSENMERVSRSSISQASCQQLVGSLSRRQSRLSFIPMFSLFLALTFLWGAKMSIKQSLWN